MTDKQIVIKPDQKSGFHSFAEEEFDACLARLIEEDRDVLIALGKS